MLPGVTHDSIVGLVHSSKGAEVIEWLMQHRQQCSAENR